MVFFVAINVFAILIAVMKKIDESYFKKPDGKGGDVHIEDLLQDGETILWKGKPRKLSFVLSSILKMMPIALLWLCFDGVFIGLLIGMIPSLPWFVYILIAVFFAFHLLPVWLWISSIVTASKRQEKEEYAFTDRRIIVKKGFIGANVESIFYPELVSVNLRIGLIERMCHVGDIYIVGSNGKTVLEDITDPYFISSKLQGIASDIKSDVIFPNAYRPKENKGYRTKYNPEDK